MFMPIEEEKKWEKEMMIELWKREGIEETKADVVYKMLKEKLDMKLISKVTGLPLKRIKELSKNK